MSIDKKAFGLSDSLVNAVNEALKGGQKKIDVAPPFGKLTGADFKKLRGEDAKPDYLDFDKDGNKKEPMKQALKQMKEVADGNKSNFKANMKEGPEEKDKTNPKQGSSVDPKQRSIGEAAAVGAPAPNMAAAMDARKSEVQRKIAQKQAMHQQSKAKQRIAGTMKEGGNKSCSCGETKESKMSCEVHGDKKMLKGGKEPIVMNPPLKEAGELPKKVITKGHEIAKSLIKHRAKVKSPYAVGMATAKKSAGIKEKAEQVDELSSKTLRSYASKAQRQVDYTDTRGFGTKHGGLPIYHKGKKRELGKDPVQTYKNRKAGADAAWKKSHKTNEEVEQVDELSKETMKSYVKAVDKRGEGVKRGTGLNTASQKIAKQEPTSTLKKTVDAIKNTPHGKMKSSSVYKFGASHAELQRRGVKEEVEQVDEVSKKVAIDAYRQRQSRATDYYSEPNDQKKADKTMNRIKNKFGSKTAKHAERGADIDDNGRKGHNWSQDYLDAKQSVYKNFSRPNSKKGTKERLGYMKMNKGRFAKEETEQVDEVLDNPIKKMSYISKAYKQIKHADPVKMANNPKEFQKVAKRTVGMQMLNKKLTKKKD